MARLALRWHVMSQGHKHLHINCLQGKDRVKGLCLFRPLCFVNEAKCNGEFAKKHLLKDEAILHAWIMLSKYVLICNSKGALKLFFFFFPVCKECITIITEPQGTC